MMEVSDLPASVGLLQILREPAELRMGLQRVLCAPGFLFLQEPAGDRPQPCSLTDHELASRLSYFLWSTMPDDELFGLAACGQLTPQLEPQVRRMRKDPMA